MQGLKTKSTQVTLLGFEPGYESWKARQDTTMPTQPPRFCFDSNNFIFKKNSIKSCFRKLLYDVNILKRFLFLETVNLLTCRHFNKGPLALGSVHLPCLYRSPQQQMSSINYQHRPTSVIFHISGKKDCSVSLYLTRHENTPPICFQQCVMKTWPWWLVFSHIMYNMYVSSFIIYLLHNLQRRNDKQKLIKLNGTSIKGRPLMFLQMDEAWMKIASKNKHCMKNTSITWFKSHIVAVKLYYGIRVLIKSTNSCYLLLQCICFNRDWNTSKGRQTQKG